MQKLNSFLEFEILHFKDYSLTVMAILGLVVIFTATKLFLWVIKKAVSRKSKFHTLDTGSSFALFQLIKYFVWIVGGSFMLKLVGVDLTILIASSAALLVGVGLGLQQTFNDIISGIILLFEQSVKVDDVLDIDGDIVVIKEIGLRTSMGLDRNQIIITLPNSLITTTKVINWSNQSRSTFFKIFVGVAYGSDVELVMSILRESAKSHPDVLDKDLVESRFIDFGNSSLDFSLLFYSENLFRIERVKSDIRQTIDKEFRKHNVRIPFPQMDVYLKK